MNEDTGYGFACWVVLTVLWVVIAAGAIDSAGRHADKGEHYGALPAKVQQLSPNSYISSEQGPSASDICGYASTPNIRSQTTLYKLEGEPIFIQCRSSQKWNVKKPLSPNLADGFVETGTSPVAWAIAAVTLLLSLIPGMRTSYKHRKRDRERRKEFRLTFEDKKNALTQLWVDEKIDDVEFEKKLGELVRQSK